MSLFGDVAGTALGGVGGGLLAHFLGQGGGSTPQPPARTPALTASGVKVDPGLTAVLGQQGQGPQNSLDAVYNRIRGRYNADNAARGLGPAGPTDQGLNRINTAQGLSNAGLKSSLESVLGNTAYSNAKQQRDFGQNYDLANYVGALNKPSPLEQVLGGLNSVAGIAGAGYGLSKRRVPQMASAPAASQPELYSDTGYYGSNLG